MKLQKKQDALLHCIQNQTAVRLHIPLRYVSKVGGEKGEKTQVRNTCILCGFPGAFTELSPELN